MSASELWDEHADEIEEIHLIDWDDELAQQFWDVYVEVSL